MTADKFTGHLCDMNGWRTDIENAPKERGGPTRDAVEFLAVRNGRHILCYYDDDRHSKNPVPYWNGTDRFIGTRGMRETPPTLWQLLPDLPDDAA